MDKPTCPQCGIAAIEAWTMFTFIEFNCGACNWTARLRDTEAMRPQWHALIIRAMRRLRTEYGLVTAPEVTQKYFQEPSPMLAWDEAAERVLATARYQVRVPTSRNVTEWEMGRAKAEAAEWAELRDWLWTAFSPALVADVPAGKAA